MILVTGGFAFGLIKTKSSFASSARAWASLSVVTPTWLPFSSINLTWSALISSFILKSFIVIPPMYNYIKKAGTKYPFKFLKSSLKIINLQIVIGR